MLQLGKEAAPDGNKLPPSEWVGGSDFRVPATTSSTIPISLTPIGRELVRTPGGYDAEVVVQLKVYGYGLTGFPRLRING
jgi:hypothetical protein